MDLSSLKTSIVLQLGVLGVIFSLVGITVFLLTGPLMKRGTKFQHLYQIRGRLSLLVAFLVLLEAIPFLEIPDTFLVHQSIIVIRFLCSLLILLITNPIINTLIAFVEHRIFRGYQNYQGVLQVFSNVIKLVIFSLLLITLPKFFLPNYEDYNLSSLLTNLTIGTSTLVAVAGFASKDLLSNFFGTLVIIAEKLFKVGDWIVVNRLEGRVVRIDIRATKLQTKAGNIIYVPNALFTNNHSTNYGQVSYHALVFSIPFGTLEEQKMQSFLAAIKRLMDQTPAILPQASCVVTDELTQAKAKLTCHLSFHKISSEKLITQMHTFTRQMHFLAEKEGISLL